MGCSSINRRCLRRRVLLNGVQHSTIFRIPTLLRERSLHALPIRSLCENTQTYTTEKQCNSLQLASISQATDDSHSPRLSAPLGSVPCPARSSRSRITLKTRHSSIGRAGYWTVLSKDSEPGYRASHNNYTILTRYCMGLDLRCTGLVLMWWGDEGTHPRFKSGVSYTS